MLSSLIKAFSSRFFFWIVLTFLPRHPFYSFLPPPIHSSLFLPSPLLTSILLSSSLLLSSHPFYSPPPYASVLLPFPLLPSILLSSSLYIRSTPFSPPPIHSTLFLPSILLSFSSQSVLLSSHFSSFSSHFPVGIECLKFATSDKVTIKKNFLEKMLYFLHQKCWKSNFTTSFLNYQ